MRRFTILFAAPWLALLSLIAVPASAQDMGSPATRLKAALDVLDAGIASADKSKGLPTLSNPEIATQYAAITASLKQIDTPSFPIDGMATFEICGAINNTFLKYITHGQEALEPFKNNSALYNQKLQALGDANGNRYQNEVTILVASTLHCFGAHFPFWQSLYASLKPEDLDEKRKGGARQMRSAMLNMASLTLSIAADTSVSLANREKLLKALNLDAVAFASILSLAQRDTFLGTLRAVKARVPPSLAVQLGPIETAYSDRKCVAICTTD